jgi:cell surface protein SprA
LIFGRVFKVFCILEKTYLERIVKNSIIFTVLVFISSTALGKAWDRKVSDNHYKINKFLFPPDSTITGDTTRKVTLPYKMEDEQFPYTGEENSNPLFLELPANIKSDVEYDPETGLYILRHKMGDFDYRPPTYMTLEEYRDYDLKNSVDDYWRERARASGAGGKDGIIPSLYIGGKAFDKVFGGHTIDIRPSGNVELIFQVLSNKRDDPTLAVKQRSQTNFDFQEKIQMNVVAKIGDKIEFKTNYNTEATFEFENKLNLRYEGEEDEILQLLEAGDVSLPLNSTLITGSQSLFGIKSKMKFGRTTVTALYSEQESQTSNITVQGGAQTNEFRIKADQYEENKHFLLSHVFRNSYDNALSDLPIITSNINITKIEVWVTNIGAAVTQNRNVVAFTDLGEYHRIQSNLIQPVGIDSFPNNSANNLFSILKDSLKVRDINLVNNYLLSLGFNPGVDFEKIELARKLSPNEFTYNSKLGFITLNSTLNSDQTLAVAYQYQRIGGDSSVYQVGEFSDEGITGQSALVVKLLKSTYSNIRSPLWDLMMKNVYSLNAYQVNRDNFILNILYSGDENGVPTGYFEEGPFSGVPLVHVFNLDNLDAQLNPLPKGDGMFDFLDNAATQGGTINSQNGRIFFTVLEPFGSYLRQEFGPDYADLAEKYCYDSLYTLTKTSAQMFTEKNKFMISGNYKSQSGSEISLNALNVPRGSVRVTAGGVPLTENVDYTVDYTLGRVRIINEGIMNSGTPINISMENNVMFSIQTKRLMGAHIDHDISKDFHIGGTILNLHERPLTQKVNYGDDPISNTIWGLDYKYQKESRFITRMVDKLPFISTSAPSNVAVDGEFAHFIPGHSRAVGSTGVSYIDDFEGTKSTIDLRSSSFWYLGSTPQFQTDLFPESQYNDETNAIYAGFNRAKIAWYVIDPSVFYDRNGNLKPDNVSNDELSNNFVRQVLEEEVFPNKELANGTPTNIGVFNVAFYPTERGPYNYDAEGIGGVSAGINTDGTLKDPQSRWGGIMREIVTPDFEASNIEYIEFWMMDPFATGTINTGQTGGDLYINLGDISEDVLKDSRKSYEHGLPTSANFQESEINRSIWGRTPNKLDLVQSFSGEAGSRQFQDVGYDGLRNADERTYFSSGSEFDKAYPFIDKIAELYGESSSAYLNAFNDPSADDYHNFRGEDYDNDPFYGSILNRYKKYNGPDGNSPENEGGGVYDGNSRRPNAEDLNNDNTLNEGERYFQYRISLRPNKMVIGENFISDIQEAAGIQLANGEVGTVKWYQFKVPVREASKVVGNIYDFKSIRFMRMFLNDFSEPIVLRFATLDLVRGEWRRYPSSAELLEPDVYLTSSQINSKSFELSAVNIEENSSREPVPYVTPPGIEREINIGTTNLTQMNEQALVIKVCELADGDAVAAYKTSEFDFRQFKRLKMFVHAEQSKENDVMKYGDLTIFVRLGSDFTQNYYEYEIPLIPTLWGERSPELIWPENNEFNIDLEQLAQYKLERNTAMRQPGSPVKLYSPYYVYEGNNRITVFGSPTLSDVKAMMIGIRNPKKTAANPEDDGENKCAEIWVNELRLSDFNKQSGWATTARVSTNLADLGNFTVSGIYSSPWFASLEKKITEIQLDGRTQFDIATNLELGKFFPQKTGIKIPMHYDYSETRITPKYNPNDPDLILSEVIDSYDLESQQDSLKALTIDYTQRKNINFMNVRKDRVGQQTKSRVYDIENFNVSYSYSKIYHRSVDIENDVQQTYMGGIGYNYNANPKNVKPFEKNAAISKSKSLTLIKDFNFYYLPKMFSFRTDMNRMYSTRKLRNKSFGDIITYPTYNKTWDWNRIYDLKFDLTQALTVNYNANAGSYINEFPGSNKETWDENKDGDLDINGVGNIEVITPDIKKQQVWDQIYSGGTKKRFTQTLGANYNIPVNKLPGLDWVTSTAGYNVAYNWTASPRSIQAELGNTIQNNVNWNINGNADLNKLYNKVGYLKKINEPPKKKPQKKPEPKEKGKDNKNLADSTKVVKPKVNVGKIGFETLIRLMLSVKKLSIQYSVNNGTTLPGFMPEPDIIGNNWSKNAPGMKFIFGQQPSGPEYFNNEGWLTTSYRLNTAFAQLNNKTMNLRATLEPFKDFKIELNAERMESHNLQTYYIYDTTLKIFKENSRMEMGTFSSSYITWGTAFGGSLENEESQYFINMKNYRIDIANRIAREDPRDLPVDDSTGYPAGYGPSSQYVMLPSFIAAYSGKSPDNVSLKPFPTVPLPNWRVSYSGLSKIPLLQGIFKSVTLNHAYKSTYNIGSFTSNINYGDTIVNGTAVPNRINRNSGDFYPEFEFNNVTITEQFSPLINFDMQFKNSLLGKLEMKKSRNLSLSFSNNQLTEVTSEEFIIGTGYRFKEVPISFARLSGGSGKTFKSDINAKIDFSLRNNKTVLRNIDSDLNQVSAGQKVTSINFSLDYMLSQSLTLRLFFDKITTNPFLPSQYRNSTTKGGISLRFSLAQ